MNPIPDCFCRGKDANRLLDILEGGGTSIKQAAGIMGRSIRYVHSLVRQWPDHFDCCGIVGPVGTWHIARRD
jgi:hypothetical protein